MFNIIPKTIYAEGVDFAATEFWADDTSPWNGYPYKYTVNYVISNPQIHSDPTTSTPFEYNGLDVKVGDWVGVGSGMALRVSSIVEDTFNHNGQTFTSPSSNAIILVLEDVEIYNLLNDSTQTGSNFVPGPAYIFELGDDGLPVFNIIPDYATTINYQSSLTSRFSRRNVEHGNLLVQQPNHNLEVGDVIYIGDNGLYGKVAANADNRDKLERIVGQVTSVGTYGGDSFTYRPRGNVIADISPALPGNAGDVIYLDPTLPGKLTATKPTRFAVALYIQLDTPTRGIYLSGSSGAGGGGGPLGYNATVYKVSTIADRDAIPVDQLQVGDQIYVADSGNGEWAMYMYAGIIGITPTWYKLTDFDTANTDAKTITVDLYYTQNQPLVIYSVGDTARVVDVTVEVIQTFHPTATLTVGDDSDVNRLTDVDDVDLSVLGTYSLSPSYQYGGTGETIVKAYYNQGSSTQGQAKITITYV